MAFTVPTFNLTFDLYTGPYLTRVYRSSPIGNLAWGRRISSYIGDWDTDAVAGRNIMTLLLPPGTDIRDQSCSPHADVLELPAGSGRWYLSQSVDDIGKGFDNEHRAALIVKIYEGLNPTAYAGLIWPTPIP